MLFNKRPDAAIELLARLAKQFERQRRSEETRQTRNRDRHSINKQEYRAHNCYMHGYMNALGYVIVKLGHEQTALMKAVEHDGESRTRQAPLFSGLSCLPGQADLFEEGELR